MIKIKIEEYSLKGKSSDGVNGLFLGGLPAIDGYIFKGACINNGIGIDGCASIIRNANQIFYGYK